MNISFCTHCKGRLEHLKETYEHNLVAGLGCEFILLSYGDLDVIEWAKKLKDVKVYYTPAKYFDMAKSKNLAASLSTGDFIFFLDADQFISSRIVPLIIKAYNENKFISQIHGAEGMKREHFFEVGGFDESFEGWGCEDQDMAVRLINLGIQPLMATNLEYRMPHDNDMRYVNYKNKNHKKMYKRNFEKTKKHIEDKTIKVNKRGFAKHKLTRVI